MRFNFLYPEQTFIDRLNIILQKLHASRHCALRTEMISAIAEVKEKLIKTQEKYKNTTSIEIINSTKQLCTQIFNQSAEFTRLTDELKTTVDYYSSHVTQMSTREATVSEFIANISTAADGGEAQAAVLGKVMTMRVVAGLTSNALSLQEAVNTLKAEDDDDVAAMIQNQERAVIACIGQMQMSEEVIKRVEKLEEDIITKWEAYDCIISDTDENKESRRLSRIISIVEKCIQKLNAIQTEHKIGITDLGLNQLMIEIEEGPKKLFDQFQETQQKHREINIKLALLAGDEIPADECADDASDTSSSVSARSTSVVSSSSFFSQSSRSSDVFSTDVEADSDEEEVNCRKRARSP
ncbi:MAG: hypothetical protein NTZ67_04960 [Gammaproteobacteria bacterium]|nr:hypothetical protein [Gammaproteobacteria bacterium]